MNNMTPAQIAERNKMRNAILNQNGNYVYRKFTGSTNPFLLAIGAISWPLTEVPNSVEFVDPELQLKNIASNDLANPDGGEKITFSNYWKPSTPVLIVPSPTKRTGKLKLVK